MKIGIDLDDTMCETTEIIHEKCEEYAQKKNMNALDVMNDETLKQDFFDEYLKSIYMNVRIKKNVKEVIQNIKKKGHEIYIITARTNDLSKNVQNVEELTYNWLKEHQIEPDKVFFASYGEQKAQVCREYKIDLMIDDNPYNYKCITTKQIPCLLFDDRGRYELKEEYATNWLDIERYIERMS